MEKNKKKKFDIFNRVMTLISIVFLCVLLFVFKYNIPEDMLQDDNPIIISENNIDTNKTENTIKPEKTTINITAIGDIMCQNTQYKDAYDSANQTYDFSYVFSEIKSRFEDSDLTIGNLETTLAGEERKYSGYPTFNTPEQLAKNLKDLGIDVLSTANNHSLDKGYDGLVSTLKFLDEQNISHTRNIFITRRV